MNPPRVRLALLKDPLRLLPHFLRPEYKPVAPLSDNQSLQAPRAWFEKLSTIVFVLQAGFRRSHHDSAMFISTSPRGRAILLLYVDDMIITGDDHLAITADEGKVA